MVQQLSALAIVLPKLMVQYSVPTAHLCAVCMHALSLIDSTRVWSTRHFFTLCNHHTEEVLRTLASHAGVVMRNAEMYTRTRRSEEKLSSMVSMVKAIASDIGANSLMFTITQRVHKLVDADRCTLFLIDYKTKELWSMQGEVNIRIPMDAGIAGSTATTGEVISIPDAYKDERFNAEIDKRSGYRTKSSALSLLLLLFCSRVVVIVATSVPTCCRCHPSGDACP